MRKIIFLLLIIPVLAKAQVELRGTLSNTILNVSFGKGNIEPYLYGGGGFGTATVGFEAEVRLRKPPFLKGDVGYVKSKKRNSVSDSTIRFRDYTSSSIEACVFYSGHSFAVDGRSADNDPLHSELDIRLIQIPIILKGNAHLSVLDENLRVSMGIGVVNSFVLKSHLSERATDYEFDTGGNLVSQQEYSDAANTTNAGRRFYNSFCIELSIGFKRLFIAERAWFNFSDMYFTNIESWDVPRTHSVYFNAHDTWSKVTYGGGAFTIGWKFN